MREEHFTIPKFLKATGQKIKHLIHFHFQPKKVSAISVRLSFPMLEIYTSIF